MIIINIGKTLNTLKRNINHSMANDKSKRLNMLAMFLWFCSVVFLVLLVFRIAILQFDHSMFVNHSSTLNQYIINNNYQQRTILGQQNASPPRTEEEKQNSQQNVNKLLVFSKKSSITTLNDLEKFVNSPHHVNPHQSERAYSAFLSVSANDRKAYDYMIGILSLFQSIKMNTRNIHQNPFILVLVPPRLEEKTSVEKTLYFMEQIVNNLSHEDRRYFHFFIAGYIVNPTNGKHSSSNSVETRYLDTFNKIHMWRLDEFGYKKVIYLDADVVILRQEIDHLFECGHFCAVSDLCVPDYFNGGLMVLKTDSKVFMDMKEKMGLKEYQSYDGGEQGFINRYFNFNKDSVFWPLEKFSHPNNPNIWEVNTGGSELLQVSVKDSVYRLPFNYNGQVPLMFISKIGWNKKFGDKFVAVHITLPLKPWEFITFPIFDVSYYWYAYFRYTKVYRTFPWTIFSINLVMILSGFIILDRVLNSKRKLTSIFAMQWIVTAIEDRINQLTGVNDSERVFTTILLNVVPTLLVIPTTTIPAILYMHQLYVQHYDPHMIWLNLVMSVGAGAFIMLGLFSWMISCCTPSLNANNSNVNLEQLEKNVRISSCGGSGWNYCVWIMSFVSYLFLGFFSLFLIPSFLFGHIVVHIACTITFFSILVALLIIKITTPLSNHVILRSLYNSVVTTNGEEKWCSSFISTQELQSSDP